MLAEFDTTNYNLLNGNSDDIYANAPGTLTLEETARLVACAEGKAVDADCAMISVLELTGREIKATREAGFDLQGDGTPYEYLLFTRGDMDLEDETVYKLAVSTGELTARMQEKAVETEMSPAGAIVQYVKDLKTVTADAVIWD